MPSTAGRSSQGRVGRRPHVGLSAHLLSLSEDYRGAGINRYIYGLLIHLPTVASHLDFTAFVADRRVAEVAPPGLRLSYPRWSTQTNRAARIVWEQAALPLAVWRQSVDLVHSMAYALPLVRAAHGVVTVHDLTFLLYPDAFNRTNRLYVTAITRASVRRANAVIADSTNTRADIIRLLGVPPQKVVAIPLGVDEQYRPAAAAEVAALRKRRGLPERFILYLGTLEPRKNIETLIHAYAKLRRQDAGAPLLVIAGGVGWRYQAVFALVETLGLTGHVLFPGFVPQAELPVWYSAAEVFVYPSLYEGFGLPPLEAMACGAPVVTSTASSLPEVVGDAGLLFDPRDTDALADALRRVLGDADLREELRGRGLARAAQFTWQRTAAATAAIYDHILAYRTLRNPAGASATERGA